MNDDSCFQPGRREWIQPSSGAKEDSLHRKIADEGWSVAHFHFIEKTIVKSSSKLLIASTLMLGMASAYAASSSNLKVAGKIVTSPCQIDTSSVAPFDFSKLPPINSGKYIAYEFPRSSIYAAVVCQDPTTVAMKITDDNPASNPGVDLIFGFPGNQIATGVDSDKYFGLKDDSNGGASIGAFVVQYQNPATDLGQTSNSANSSDAKNWTNVVSSGLWNYPSNRAPYVMASSSSTPTPIAATRFEFPLRIAATIIKDRLSPDSNTSVSGSVTLEFVYL